MSLILPCKSIEDISMQRPGVGVALVAVAALVTAPGIADDVQPQDCSFFRGRRLVTVGGHEDKTPVIPLFADVVTYDLWTNQACHTLEWSVYTKNGVSHQDSVCFDIGDRAENRTVVVSAELLTGVTVKEAATYSTFEDRDAAKNLAATCRMHLNARGSSGLDI
ncbi:MAG TPA: hypothetical protein VGM32_01160 [Rhodopila sp.]